MNAQPLVNINRFEALVTENKDEDMNGPATFGVVRLLAAHIDSAFSQIQGSLIRLDDKIDNLERRLDDKIDILERRLDDKIDGLEQKLTARIDGLEQRLDDKIDSKVDGLEIRLRSELTANHGIIMDQFAQRANSDRFIKVGFAVAVIGVLVQTTLQMGLAAFG